MSGPRVPARRVQALGRGSDSRAGTRSGRQGTVCPRRRWCHLEEFGADDRDNDRPKDCDCGEWNDGLGLCCWPCYRDGFETPNPNAKGDGE